MTLIKCKECEKEISSEAKECPNCGYKLQKIGFFGGLIITIFTFYIALTAFEKLFGVTQNSDSHSNNPANNSSKQLPDPLSEKRWEFASKAAGTIKVYLREPESLEWIKFL